MRQFFGTDFEGRKIVVGEGDTLSLGKHNLTFVLAPMVHWPEVLMTYDETDNLLLTADAFGILPPIAKLTPDQAMYHFLSGYTARVAGTEIGVTEPEATFSTCFGAPFMPRHPSVYGNLLKERIAKGGVQCWLVNTGWTGGMATMDGIKRMPIKATRALLNSALDGSLNDAEFRKDPNFGFMVPVAVPGVDSALLDPREAWADKAAYDRTAQTLVGQFIDNFAQFFLVKFPVFLGKNQLRIGIKPFHMIVFLANLDNPNRHLIQELHQTRISLFIEVFDLF